MRKTMMTPSSTSGDARLRTARCACGQLQLTLAGPPRRAYACACLECQRATGSAFAWRAIYPEDSILERAGEPRLWRRTGTSGAWLEQAFCPNCGVILYMTAEGLQGAVSVSAGAFADRDFPPPVTLHWSERRAPWLCLEGVAESN